MPLFRKESSENEASVVQALQQRTAQELAVADATELVNYMSRHCFDLCYATPGESVTNAQSQCTKACVSKYLAAWDLLSQTYVSRIQSEQRQAL